MNTAIVLAAGSGRRMNSATKKQYINIDGKPLVYYALKAFCDSERIDRIIIVTASEDIDYFRQSIVEKYGISKVSKIISGGKERYNSVYNGLQEAVDSDYVFIHDGARPFVTSEEIDILAEAVEKHKACIAAVRTKDTVKISDEEGYVIDTPIRSNVWLVQTPQVFAYDIIYKAYEKMMKSGDADITDDAMVVERYGRCNIKLIELSYENIKVTTPEDIYVVQGILESRKNTRKSG